MESIDAKVFFGREIRERLKGVGWGAFENHGMTKLFVSDASMDPIGMWTEIAKSDLENEIDAAVAGIEELLKPHLKR